jgi:hypothetical protein
LDLMKNLLSKNSKEENKKRNQMMTIIYKRTKINFVIKFHKMMKTTKFNHNKFLKLRKMKNKRSKSKFQRNLQYNNKKYSLRK